MTETDPQRHHAARASRLFGFPKRQSEEIEWERVSLTPDQASAQRAIAEAVQGGGTILLHGDQGIGKTLIACGLGIAWWRAKFNGKRLPNGDPYNKAWYFRASDFFAQLIRWQQDQPRTEWGLKPSPDELARKAGLLVLDEIGEIKYSDFQSTTLSNLIDYRYAEGKGTLLIGNPDPARLIKLGMSPNIIDRLRDGAIIDARGWSNMRGSVA